LLAIVAAHFIKNLDEHGEEGIDLRLADHIRLLIDVEQNALGRNRHCPFEVPSQNFIVCAFGQKKVESRNPINLTIFQDQGEYFQEVRFAGAKKAGDPNSVDSSVIVICIQEGLQAFGHLVGQHILFDFKAKTRLVIRFDDPFNPAVDWLVKNALQNHFTTSGYASQ